MERQDIVDILGTHATVILSPENLHLATQWLTELTVRLQRAQQILYAARVKIIHANKAKEIKAISIPSHRKL
jgi:hypothetical protein